MKTIDTDARRYAWCWGQALWNMALPVTTFEEDLRGALGNEQHGLARHVGRALGELLATVAALLEADARPIPPPAMRGAWALEQLRGHELYDDCWWLMRGAGPDVPVEEIGERCERLLARVRDIVGDVPDPLKPEEYFPSMALARDWLNLLREIDEEGFLPREWTGV